ncbi:MAG TPA: hypothetical protein VMH87_13330 [Pseudomonadales bacterium]|nr:hypothetical protein [Pseudomonadales bacterium]
MLKYLKMTCRKIAGAGIFFIWIFTVIGIFEETASGQPLVLNHILGTGQSLSIGTMGNPALTTNQPYGNLTLSFVSSSNFQQAGTVLVPLIEGFNADGVNVETISSALANTLTALPPQTNYTSIVTRDGEGGAPYSALKKGTGPYTLGLLEITNAMAAAHALGDGYQVSALTCVHGEQDDVLGNGQYYAGYLRQWQHDVDSDAKAITGQTNDVPMFLCQYSSWTIENDAATSLVPSAQLYATETYANHFLVCPKYFFTYADGVHLTAQSYRWLGEYYGKVMKKVLVDGQRWRPLTPDSISINGNNITVTLHVPVPPIVNDTTDVLPKTYFGFEYTDDSSSAAISSAHIGSSNTVIVTLNHAPTGAHPRLRYAYTGTPGSWAGANQSGSARGNIRDSDATPSLYGNKLANWLVHFNYPIPFNAAYPVPIAETSLGSGQGIKIAWQTASGSSNFVDYATSLTPPIAWSNLYFISGSDPSLVYANSSIYTTAVYTNNVTQPQCFYRVRIQ